MKHPVATVLLIVTILEAFVACVCFAPSMHTLRNPCYKTTIQICDNSLCNDKTRKGMPTSLKAGSVGDGSDRQQQGPGLNRRHALPIALASICVTTGLPRRVDASTKSRTEGYSVQKSAEEWKSQLTKRQYEILREGGTERPYSSVLEGEERNGKYYCAGCGTALFESSQKFHSGTGWPSFALALPGVEVEKVGPIQANLAGAELRCATCGGHLGDVFNDGFLFVGTPAFQSGKRFCIDGAALVFRADDGDNVIGDAYPPLRSLY